MYWRKHQDFVQSKQTEQISHQVHQVNITKYYKRSFTIPVIELLENDLNARFSEKNLKIFDGLTSYQM